MNTNPLTFVLGAAISTVLMFIIYSSQYNNKILRSKLYRWIFYALFYMEITEGIYYFTAYYLPENLLLISIASKLHWIIGFVIFLGCLYYIKSYVNPELKTLGQVIGYKQSKLIDAAVGICVITFLILPVKPFTSTGEISFVPGLPAYIVFAFAIAVLIRISIFSYKSENVDKKNLKTFNIYFYLISIITVGLQMLFPTIALIPLGLTFLIYTLYYLAENPDIYVIEDLTKIKDKISQRSNLKTELLYNLSEDFNKPVNNIIKYSKRIIKDEKLDEHLEENLDEITNNGRDLIEVIDNLIESSNIEDNSASLDAVAYSLADIFRELKTENEYKLKNANISYEVNIHPNTPNKFYGDKGKVKKAIESAVLTALKETEIGKIIIKVNSSISGNKCDINIVIIDTGKGIRKEYLNDIFDISKNNSQGYKLPIANKYVEMLGGNIKVDSTYLAGTEVIMSIPQIIRDYSPIKLDESIQVTDKKLVIKDYNKQKILIVDEDVLNRKVIKNILEPYNFDIDEVSCGIDCLNRIKSEIKYSLILIDHQMDGLDGPEVLAALIKLKNYFEVPPVIMVTANVATGIREKYLSEGFDDYIGKPVTIAELNRIINSYVKVKNTSGGYEVNEMKFDDVETKENAEVTNNFESALNTMENTKVEIKPIEESTPIVNEEKVTLNEEQPQNVELTEIAFEDVEHSSNSAINLMDPNQK